MTTPLKTTAPSPAMMAARIAMIDALRPFEGQLTAYEQLAVASYLVGQLIAHQDQRVITPVMALDLVQANIETGNKSALQQMNEGGRL